MLYLKKLLQINPLTLSFNTASWSTSAYTEVIAASTLSINTVYVAKAYYNAPGQDASVTCWLIPIINTNSGSAGNMADLASNSAIYGVGSGRFIIMRLKKGNGTFGLEAKLSQSDMASAGYTVDFSITPLL